MRFLIDHKWILLVILVVITALVLTVMSALSPGHAVGASGWLGGLLRPVQESLGSISDRASSMWNSGGTINELLAENARLRQHAADVEEQARLYEQTLKENERYRKLLEFKERRRDFTFTPATIIARDTDNYAKTFTISRGSKHGAEPQMPVVNEVGQLIGVVSEVGDDWSIVRTLTDTDFACGAYAFRAGVDGVCKGKFELMNDGKLTMTGFTPGVDIKLDDEVLTSGAGGLFPRDIVIGKVSALEPDTNGMTATVIIVPAADLKYIEQVFLVTSFESEE